MRAGTLWATLFGFVGATVIAVGFRLGGNRAFFWQTIGAVTVLCAISGFASGMMHSRALLTRFRNRTVSDLRPARAALWGGLASVGIPAAMAGVGLLAGATVPWKVVLVLLGALGAVGAGTAAATVAVAQRVVAHLGGATPNDA